MGRLGQNPSSRGYATPTYATTPLTARETFGGTSKAGLGRHIGMGPFTYSAIVNGSSGHQAPPLAGNSFLAAYDAGKLLDPEYPISKTNQLARVGTGTTGGMTRTPADGVNLEERKEMQERVDAWNKLWPARPIRDTPNECCKNIPNCECKLGYNYFYILSSTNGEQWSLKAETTAPPFDLMYDVYYDDGTWVAVGSGSNPILYSTDNAETWAAVNPLARPYSNPSTDYYSSVHYANNTWVAVGSATYPIIYSTDGISWSPGWFQQFPNIPVFSSGVNRTIYYANGTWVAVGSGSNTILYSTDNAQTWFAPTGDDLGPQGSCNSVYYDNSKWIAVGYSSTTPGPTILSSANGQSWTIVFEEIGAAGNFFDVYSGNGDWVAVSSSNESTVYSTDNGLTWSAPTTAPAWLSSEGGNRVYYDNGVWVAVGTAANTSSSCIFTATNLNTWTPASGANGSLFGEQDVNSVYYSGNKWVACGASTQNSIGIIYSADGQSWTSVSGAGGVKGSGSNIYYDNGKWIIAGLFAT